VIKTQIPASKDPGRIELSHEVRVEDPSWFAVRAESDTKTEFDKTLFAHTSPFYITFNGKRPFDVDSALALLKQVEEGQAAIQAKGRFSTPAARRCCWGCTTRRPRICVSGSTPRK